MDADGTHDRARLLSGWDRLVRGEPAAPSHLDPPAAETVRRLHALDAADHRPDPDPAFVARLERALRASAAPSPAGRSAEGSRALRDLNRDRPTLRAVTNPAILLGRPIPGPWARPVGDAAAPQTGSPRPASSRPPWAWSAATALALVALLVGLGGFLSDRITPPPTARAPIAAFASPTPDVPPPAACTVEPRKLNATVKVVNGYRLRKGGAPAAATPGRGPADTVDAATVAAVSATVRQWVACRNAGDWLRQWALVSDDGLARVIFGPKNEMDSQGGIYAWDPSRRVKTPTVVPAADRVEVIDLRDVRWTGDGRVVANLVTIGVPTSLGPIAGSDSVWRAEGDHLYPERWPMAGRRFPLGSGRKRRAKYRLRIHSRDAAGGRVHRRPAHL